jgi:uncharacterized membrane protein
MSKVAKVVELPDGLSAEAAYELWIDTSRWPTFVDGFKHVETISGDWPNEGAKLVWRSPPAGRGRVTEKVIANEPGARFATIVFEERITGTQTVTFTPQEVTLELEYELQQGGPLKALVDALFIRRSQSESLQRTLTRFRREAGEAL